jgi:hypothetical protein
MASDDASDPANPADPNQPARNCDKCDAVMKQLGEFPALSIHAAIRIFRCYVCNHLVSERA